MSGSDKIEVIIRNILEKYSSKENPLTQEQIGEYLERDFRIERDRKSIGAAIANLKESGLNVVFSPGKGSYLAD
ncbi:MAG: hypothetical protein K6G50_02280 [bacterium]|nr:hypothetical protein [bacterium]